MNAISRPWDYLIVTASNEAQARAYERQLKLRKRLGLISDVERVLVVADPGGQRIGSGGSTIYALLKVLSRELEITGLKKPSSSLFAEALDRLRILIIHAGGDSRRLPAYGPCGKIFIPIPGESDSALGSTLFDRQFPIYRELPPPRPPRGQIVLTTGDVLLFFSPDEIRFAGNGVTGLGCPLLPEQAKNHGVFCPDEKGEVRFFLQKPSVSRQRNRGAVDRYGKALLDIGVMELDAATAAKFIALPDIKIEDGELLWSGPIAEEIMSLGLDFYRDICCAMGSEVRFEDFRESVRDSGSALSESSLKAIFESLSDIPFFVHSLPDCIFLHFGTPRQIIESGTELLRRDRGIIPRDIYLDVNNRIRGQGRIAGGRSWVEGCRLSSALTVEGENMVVGADVDTPLKLPAKSCLDILKGRTDGDNGWFIRIYGIDDSFKAALGSGATICNHPANKWLGWMGVSEQEIFDKNLAEEQKNLWNARIFPAASSPGDSSDWLWMLNPDNADKNSIRSWQKARKFNLSEISGAIDHEDFFLRRKINRADEIRRSLRSFFGPDSGFSAQELAYLLEDLEAPGLSDWISQILKEALGYIGEHSGASRLEQLAFCRIAHTLGTAVQQISDKRGTLPCAIIRAAADSLSGTEREKLMLLGLDPQGIEDIRSWSSKAQECAFEYLGRTIVQDEDRNRDYPRSALRRDEIIWGRAPARLDLGGGWTDTPPYALERGGCVMNAAVNLNGQAPIHVYARIVDEPVIRITSIDHGKKLTIKSLAELHDYKQATSTFGLAKAALVLSGFSLEKADWPGHPRTLKDMLLCFGGGIELTTLAAIPSGSGLGTSSIIGAVLMSVINRMIGRKTTDRELFSLVLQMEQELTTGGGWQDQIGGIVEGVKMIVTEKGLVPDPRIHFVKADVLDPGANGAQTLLYYTGMRRLAKNILRNIVGRYMDRDRLAMDTLSKLHAHPPLMADAMSRRDMKRFGELVDLAWRLNKRIDPDSSNSDIEKILGKFEPHIHGAKLLGAGGGGFLLVVCKSSPDAEAARAALEKEPPNHLARFFDYTISTTGIEVTVC
jgi:fucokinase